MSGPLNFAPSGGGGIGGDTGAADNALLGADGTGGETLQAGAVFLAGAGLSTLQFDGTGAQNVIIGDSAFGPNGLVVLAGNASDPGHIDARRLVIPMPEDDAPFNLTGGGGVITNTGATGQVIATLPASPAAFGLDCSFAVTVAQNLQIKAQGSHVIRVGGSASSAGGTATCGTVGACITLCYVAANNWTALGQPTGTWTLA